MQFISDYYLWIKASHIISIIAWMAGLLYLPRLFVYHNEAPVNSSMSKIFLVMERRLLKYIMLPAMLASYVTGILMLCTYWNSFSIHGWLHLKLTCVALLTICHHYMGTWFREFQRDERNHSTIFFRVANEVPTIVMIVIIVMVIVKPF